MYEEEENTQNINDLNVEADRVIAMNPSGVIENFEENVNNKKYKCTGDSCVILNDDDEECTNGVCSINSEKSASYSKYIIYFIIFIVLCALAYFAYKKYTGCSA